MPATKLSLVTLAKLEKEKEELLEELKKNSSRSIYNEFEAIYKKIHVLLIVESYLR